MSKRIWKSLVGGLMISKDVTVAHCVLPVHIVHMPPMHIGHIGQLYELRLKYFQDTFRFDPQFNYSENATDEKDGQKYSLL